jgi:flagellar M-ring protein FliF
MSVSLLLDQHVRWEGKGAARHAVPVPLPAETIKSVHDLVAGVTGFVQERGDQITVESLPFESTLQADPGPDQTAGPGSSKEKPFNWRDLLKDKKMMMFAGGGALLLILILSALVFLMKRGRGKKHSGAQAAIADNDKVTKADLMLAVEEAKTKAALEAAEQAKEMEDALTAQMAEQHRQDMAAIAALKVPAASSKKTELLAKEIRENTKKDPGVSAHVIQTWMHES